MLALYEGKPSMTGGFHSQKASYVELALPVIWESMSLMWRHDNDIYFYACSYMVNLLLFLKDISLSLG